MRIVTAEEMRDIDVKTIRGFGLSGLILMERAGLSVASRVNELFGKKKCIVIAGGGNNGGDGLVVARDLYNQGRDVKVFLCTPPESLQGDALAQYQAALNFGVPVRPVQELLAGHAPVIGRHSLIVDAVFGTGLRRKVSGLLLEVIAFINKSGLPVISVDIPSGISSDNGQVMGDAVRADCTVTFGLPKRGHLLYPGAEYTGKLFVSDIGFPRQLLLAGKSDPELLEKKFVSGLMPLRSEYSHKGTYGHVLIVAGSKGKTGAALMAARACLRTGAGLVTIGVSESLEGIFQSVVREEMVLGLPDSSSGLISARAYEAILGFLRNSADILAIGPGMGISGDTRKLVKKLVEHADCPIVIDADGINSLEHYKEVLSRAKKGVILTPHPGEMARLIYRGQHKGRKTVLDIRDDIERDRIAAAISFAGETGTVLVLKGVPTIIASPDGKAYINSTGNAGMATGGTGDVLTGMVSGFLGQNVSLSQAGVLGSYLHGLAGDIAAEEKGQHSLVATDIIDALPAAFRSMKQDNSCII